MRVSVIPHSSFHSIPYLSTPFIPPLPTHSLPYLCFSSLYSHHLISVMPNCPTCTKPVYFGERVQSLGKDWHRACLRCHNDTCKKTLASGSHSENGGKPYCNRCYGALFGPKGYGHGGTESHTFLGGST